MGKYEVTVLPDDKQLAQSAAEQWLNCLAGAERGKPFIVALSGGRIARTFFSSVAKLGKNKRNLFETVHFFWADERCVPPVDPESNYRIAEELMFTPLNIAQDNVHRIPGEEPPQAAVVRAEKKTY